MHLFVYQSDQPLPKWKYAASKITYWLNIKLKSLIWIGKRNAVYLVQKLEPNANDRFESFHSIVYLFWTE